MGEIMTIRYDCDQKVGGYGIKFLKEIPSTATGRKRRRALFKCTCGSEFECIIESISSGQTKSCGCKTISMRSKSNTIHGMSRTKPYELWSQIRDRCNNKNNSRYDRYGGRGIKVCESWDASFDEFHKWFLLSGYKKGLQIDRINNDEGYSPDNCRFVTPMINSRNRGVRRSNKTGISGVNMDKKSGKYRVVIGDGKGGKKHIGFYSDFFEACCARKSAENAYWR